VIQAKNDSSSYDPAFALPAQCAGGRIDPPFEIDVFIDDSPVHSLFRKLTKKRDDAVGRNFFERWP
jgi:hypothetical protein